MAAMTMAGADAHRMEQKKLEYFSSINSMARKIMQEREKIKDTVDREEVICYPKLLVQTGQKIVHFGEEDITWQDEHSAPFSWETKSQLDFSLTTGESVQGISSSTADYKPSKVTQVNKLSNGESLGQGRKEEESSFWKISAERSRLEGEQAEFQSLTPSQIKSMEKGEKPLPSYLRQETTPKEGEETPPRVSKHRASRPPAPPPPVPVCIPPPAAISVTPMSVNPPPAPISVSSTVAGWERAQSTLPSVCNTVDDVFTPSLVTKNMGLPTKSLARVGTTDRDERAAAQGEAQLATSPTFAQQFNTSSNVLKTGFDFLDNCLSDPASGTKVGGPVDATATQNPETQAKQARGDLPEEPEPTSPVSDFDQTYNYILSRLAEMDQAIHRLNVGHYTLDVKVTQLSERVSRQDSTLGDLEDTVQQISFLTKENLREIGRLEGCQKGRRVGYKCYLVYRAYETYAGAAQKCLQRGGRMAMPRDRKDQEALADYVKAFFQPGNWPVWLGINDLRSEGLYLFEDNTRVTYFQWRKHFLSSQPDGGKRENCVAMASDDGDWWDNYCDRSMYYLCEFDA
ncbi:hypothetical protein DPEC_G00084900 [Dallia pectoralis]|uniref:Uncharacterized protein n=1 Tax=Dallia pectoralis TaxID=75939 RepID=A0ACC2GZ49_DALPE|nr:hypothetical protein DPEC_G00084900 [Dallia pectoralis]